MGDRPGTWAYMGGVMGGGGGGGGYGAGGGDVE